MTESQPEWRTHLTGESSILIQEMLYGQRHKEEDSRERKWSSGGGAIELKKWQGSERCVLREWKFEKGVWLDCRERVRGREGKESVVCVVREREREHELNAD